MREKSILGRRCKACGKTACTFSSVDADYCDRCLNELRIANGVKPKGTPDMSDPGLRIHNYRGLTKEQWAAMLADQNGRCAICDEYDHPAKLMIDHNHNTGEVRGLLCGRCNTGLGLFGDSPDLLDAAAEYLEERGSYGRHSLRESEGT